MIIDCHVHLNRYWEKQPETLDERVLELERQMKRNRVDIALILTSFLNSDARPCLDDIVKVTSEKKHLWVVAGISYQGLDSTDWNTLRGYLKNGLVRGLKLYPGYEPFFPSDPKLRVVYELAEEFEVPVMVHCGDTFNPKGRLKYAHPLNIDEVAVDFPRVKFVICHLGNPWFDDTMEVIYKNSNVYADISGLVLGDFSDRYERFMCKKFEGFLVVGVEPSKVLYGTDWPIASMESYLRFVDDLHIPSNEKSQILFHNAAALFKLSPEHSMIGNNNKRFSIFSR
jgi:predicted TIM-barrel fold metal-dependent hydrolase